MSIYHAGHPLPNASVCDCPLIKVFTRLFYGVCYGGRGDLGGFHREKDTFHPLFIAGASGPDVPNFQPLVICAVEA